MNEKVQKTMIVPRNLKASTKNRELLRKLKLRVIMSDKARLPWKQGRVTFCVCLLLSFSHLTYTLSKQLALLYFKISSCCQHIKFPVTFQSPGYRVEI